MQKNAIIDPIEVVREFNRFYTRHLGILEDGYLQSEFNLTQARIIYELAQVERATATDLQNILGHNAGYLSRLIAKLRRDGLIVISPSSRDGRERLLSLTAEGMNAAQRLEQRSRQQVQHDLNRLAPTDHSRLIASLKTVHALLGRSIEPMPKVTIRTHHPGDIGWIVQKHGELYDREYAWNSEFEALVAGIGADFLRTFDPDRERCWIADLNGQPVGSVMLVKHPECQGVAKLRLLLVDPAARGHGAGRRLVDACTDFAREAGYTSISLWTNSVLTGARHIYRSAGYRLLDETPVHLFGHDLISETWELTL